MLGAEDREDGLDLGDGGGRRAVGDDDERLVSRVDIGAVERVARDDLDIGREVALEGGDFGCLARCLAANYGPELGCCRERASLGNALLPKICVKGTSNHTWAVLSDHAVNGGSFNAVDDVIAGAGDVVAIAADLYIVLFKENLLSRV